LAASLEQVGLHLDVAVANGKIGPWLADIAHQRIHGTTGEKPQALLEAERLSLQPLPLPDKTSGVLQQLVRQQALPVESLQHPLSLYDQLLVEAV